ncbi:hypothetical protein ACLB2K_069019 [Fragaria x ananassa]
MNCVRTVTYSFLVNGEPCGNLRPTRGLRQGDAISPYLFLSCVEVLSQVITKAEVNGRLKGVKVCMNAPTFSHLFFTDDSFIFSKAEVENVLCLNEIFVAYENMSGKQINYEKSSFSFNKSVPLWKQYELATLLGVKRVEKHDKYLGLPTDLSYSKDDAFRFLVDRVRKRTQGWRDKTLSGAGTEDMRVCDLIEEGTGGWNEWLVEEDLFTPMEFELILKIPLSLNGGEDRLAWHFDKSCYSVKSGYYVGRLLASLELKASGSDSGAKCEKLWCKL